MRRGVSLLVLCLAATSLTSLDASPVRAEDPPILPPSATVEGVPARPQQRNLSCESRSAADLAAYWGAEVAEDAFFRRLPKSDNPQRGFVGDVDMPPGSMPPDGYGVYAPPVAATLRSFGLDARAHRHFELDALKRELAAQRPVIVWATYDMQLPGVETWVSWDGEASTVVRWQHTFIAVGYDDQGISLIDAYDARTKRFAYDAFVAAWDQLDRMAVTVSGPLTRPSPRKWTITTVQGLPQFLIDGRWRVGPE